MHQCIPTYEACCGQREPKSAWTGAPASAAFDALEPTTTTAQPTVVKYGLWLEDVHAFLDDLAHDQVRFVDIGTRAQALIYRHGRILELDDKRR